MTNPVGPAPYVAAEDNSQTIWRQDALISINPAYDRPYYKYFDFWLGPENLANDPRLLRTACRVEVDVSADPATAARPVTATLGAYSTDGDGPAVTWNNDTLDYAYQSGSVWTYSFLQMSPWSGSPLTATAPFHGMTSARLDSYAAETVTPPITIVAIRIYRNWYISKPQLVLAIQATPSSGIAPLAVSLSGTLGAH